MKIKKVKKGIFDMTATSMMGAGGSLALGAIGGTPATYGQQGISNAMSFMPITGTMMGTGMLMDSVKMLEPKKRRKRK